MPLTRIRESAAIVCVGAFNPTIFHPAWFAARNLIQKTEEEGAEIQVVNANVAQFKMKWLQMQVLRERLSATAETPDNFPLLRDVVVGAFGLLEHTPVTALGLNRHIHFEVHDAREWHHVGHVFAPKTIWRRYLKEPGLGVLSIKARRPDKRKGEINVQINPPVFGQATPYVIEVLVNSHFDVGETPTAGAVAQLIAEEWGSVMEFAEKVAVGVVEDALREKAPHE